MFPYKIENINIFLEDNETEILSYFIYPINKESHVFICYEKNKTIIVKAIKYSTADFKELISRFGEKSCTVNELLMQRETVDWFKEKFVTLNTDTQRLSHLIKEIADVDFSHPRTLYSGQDGFRLECHVPGKAKSLSLWCISQDEYFSPVVDLANYLMDLKGIDQQERFTIGNSW